MFNSMFGGFLAQSHNELLRADQEKTWAGILYDSSEAKWA